MICIWDLNISVKCVGAQAYFGVCRKVSVGSYEGRWDVWVFNQNCSCALTVGLGSIFLKETLAFVN